MKLKVITIQEAKEGKKEELLQEARDFLKRQICLELMERKELV
jgi:hypothetical protein